MGRISGLEIIAFLTAIVVTPPWLVSPWKGVTQYNQPAFF